MYNKICLGDNVIRYGMHYKHEEQLVKACNRWSHTMLSTLYCVMCFSTRVVKIGMASNVRRRINQHVNGFEQYAGADKKEIWISYLKNEFFKDRQIEQITLAKFEQWISAQGVDAERRGKEFYILNSHLSEVPNSVNKIFTEMAKW